MTMKNLMIIDSDLGSDDAFAILMALAFQATWEVIAITCVFGNVEVKTATENALKVLKVYNASKIPVYRGCDGPLGGSGKPSFFFGQDGFGGVGQQFSHSGLDIAKGHAANALVNLARKYRNENLHLAALGPMSNIAMAHRLDPDFTKNLKSISFMGGNIKGVGNIVPAAEANFYHDPEAAGILLNEAKCPLKMIPWETALKSSMSLSIYENLQQKDSDIAKFFKSVSAVMVNNSDTKFTTGLVDCDSLAIVNLLDPKCISRRMKYPVSVETCGRITRGAAVVERVWNASENRNVIDIVTAFDQQCLNYLRNKMLGG